MAGIEIEEDYLHDAVVDVPAGRGVGVNGLNVVRCAIQGSQIRLEILHAVRMDTSTGGRLSPGRADTALPGYRERDRGWQLERGRFGEGDSTVTRQEPIGRSSSQRQSEEITLAILP